MARRIGLVAVTNLLVELNSLIMLPLLTKNLPASEYGMWVQITVTIGLVPAISLLGLPYAMARFLPAAKGRDNIREIFYSMSVIMVFAGLAVSSVVFSMAEPIASALFDGRTLIVRYLSILILMECLISIPFGYFRGIQNIKKYSAFNLLKVFFSLMLVIHFIISGKGIVGAVSGLLLADAMIFFAMISFVILDLGISFPKLKNIRDYLAFGIPTIPGNLSSWIVTSSNRYVIGILMGTTFVGYFSPGYTLGNMINLFIAPLSFILPAALSEHYDKHNAGEVKAILGSSLRLFLALGIPAAFGLSMLSRPILDKLSTPEIAAQSYLITPFMALGSLFLGIYSIIGQVLLLEKNTALIGKIWIIAAVLNLSMSFLLVNNIGIIGGAIASLSSFFFVFIVSNYYVRRSMKIELSPVFVFKLIISSIVMSLILLGLKPEDVFELVSAIAAGAFMYFTVLLIIKGITISDINHIKEIILSSP